MITFEVGKIYQSRDNEYRSVKIVARTPCYVTVYYIVDGEHQIDTTKRLKIRGLLDKSSEMIFDATDAYHATREVTERRVIADVRRVENEEFVTPELLKAETEVIGFEKGKCYLSTDQTTKVMCVKLSYAHRDLHWSEYAQFIVLNRDFLGYNYPPVTYYPYLRKGKLVKRCVVRLSRWDDLVFYADNVADLLPTDIVPDHHKKLELIHGFEVVFKDNYRNENPEQLHPKNHHLTYKQVINGMWEHKYSELFGMKSYDHVYHAIRSEGYVINQTTLTVESKRFKPCDIKVGGR